MIRGTKFVSEEKLTKFAAVMACAFRRDFSEEMHVVEAATTEDNDEVARAVSDGKEKISCNQRLIGHAEESAFKAVEVFKSEKSYSLFGNMPPSVPKVSILCKEKDRLKSFLWRSLDATKYVSSVDAFFKVVKESAKFVSKEQLLSNTKWWVGVLKKVFHEDATPVDGVVGYEGSLGVYFFGNVIVRSVVKVLVEECYKEWKFDDGTEKEFLEVANKFGVLARKDDREFHFSFKGQDCQLGWREILLCR